MKLLHPFPLFLAAITCGALMHSRAEPFAFAPKDGDHFLENSHREVTTEMDGQTTNRDVDVSDTVTEVGLKVPAGSIRMDRTVKSLTETDNGRPISNPALQLIVNRTTTNVFNASGKFLRIEGNENLIKDAERIFPDRLHSTLEAHFAPAVLEAGEKSLWELVDRGSLIGHEIKVRERWESEHPAPLQNQQLTMKVVSRVVEVKRADGRSQATVLSFGSTDPALLKSVDRPEVTSLQDPVAQDFLSWNVADLPLEKTASEVAVDARTLRLIQRETYTVVVGSTPAGIETRTDHETLTSKPLAAH